MSHIRKKKKNKTVMNKWKEIFPQLPQTSVNKKEMLLDQ